MAQKPIRVLVVDESRFFCDLLAKCLSADISTCVVGTVDHPDQALQAIRLYNPNIVLMDISSPGVDYRALIRRAHRNFGVIPFIVLCPTNSRVFDVLKAGAVDFINKPSTHSQENSLFVKDVLAKVKSVYAGSVSDPIHTAAVPSPHTRPRRAPAKRPEAPARSPILSGGNLRNAANQIIAIGASTGGTEAILAVVRDLPAQSPGVVIVQHMPPVFTQMYAARLNRQCHMEAREAKDGDRVRPGLILVAEGEHQMRVMRDTKGFYVKVGGTEKVSGHCPSVDVLFGSVAKLVKENAVGVILTGMGGDGAKNLLKMREAGAYTIGQDEATSVVYGMPMVAYNLGAVVDQLPLGEISGAIIRHFSK